MFHFAWVVWLLLFIKVFSNFGSEILWVGLSVCRSVCRSVGPSTEKNFPFFSLFCLLLLWADIDFLLNDDEEEKEEKKEEEEYEEEEEEKEQEEDEEEEEDTE